MERNGQGKWTWYKILVWDKFTTNYRFTMNIALRSTICFLLLSTLCSGFPLGTEISGSNELVPKNSYQNAEKTNLPRNNIFSEDTGYEPIPFLKSDFNNDDVQKVTVWIMPDDSFEQLYEQNEPSEENSSLENVDGGSESMQVMDGTDPSDAPLERSKRNANQQQQNPMALLWPEKQRRPYCNCGRRYPHSHPYPRFRGWSRYPRPTYKQPDALQQRPDDVVPIVQLPSTNTGVNLQTQQQIEGNIVDPKKVRIFIEEDRDTSESDYDYGSYAYHELPPVKSYRLQPIQQALAEDVLRNIDPQALSKILQEHYQNGKRGKPLIIQIPAGPQKENAGTPTQPDYRPPKMSTEVDVKQINSLANQQNIPQYIVDSLKSQQEPTEYPDAPFILSEHNEYGRTNALPTDDVLKMIDPSSYKPVIVPVETYVEPPPDIVDADGYIKLQLPNGDIKKSYLLIDENNYGLNDVVQQRPEESKTQFKNSMAPQQSKNKYKENLNSRKQDVKETIKQRHPYAKNVEDQAFKEDQSQLWIPAPAENPVTSTEYTTYRNFYYNPMDDRNLQMAPSLNYNNPYSDPSALDGDFGRKIAPPSTTEISKGNDTPDLEAAPFTYSGYSVMPMENNIEEAPVSDGIVTQDSEAGVGDITDDNLESIYIDSTEYYVDEEPMEDLQILNSAHKSKAKEIPIVMTDSNLIDCSTYPSAELEETSDYEITDSDVEEDISSMILANAYGTTEPAVIVEATTLARPIVSLGISGAIDGTLETTAIPDPNLELLQAEAITDLELDEAIKDSVNPTELEDQDLSLDVSSPQISPQTIAKPLPIARPIMGLFTIDGNSDGSDLEANLALAAAAGTVLPLYENGFRYDGMKEQKTEPNFAIQPAQRNEINSPENIVEPLSTVKPVIGTLGIKHLLDLAASATVTADLPLDTITTYAIKKKGITGIIENLELNEVTQDPLKNTNIIITPLELENQALLSDSSPSQISPQAAAKPIMGLFAKDRNSDGPDLEADLALAAEINAVLPVDTNGLKYDGMKEQKIEPNFVIQPSQPKRDPVTTELSEFCSTPNDECDIKNMRMGPKIQEPYGIFKGNPSDEGEPNDITEDLELNEVTKDPLVNIKFVKTTLADLPGAPNLPQTTISEIFAEPISIVKSATGLLVKDKNPDDPGIGLDLDSAAVADLPLGINGLRYDGMKEEYPGPNFIIQPLNSAQDCIMTPKGCDDENIEDNPKIGEPHGIFEEVPIDNLGLQDTADYLELNEVTKKPLKSVNLLTTPLALEDQSLLGESNLPQTNSPDAITKSLSIVKQTTGLIKGKNPEKPDLDLEAALATAIDVSSPPDINGFRYGGTDEQTPGPNFVIQPSNPAQDCTTTPKGYDNENAEENPKIDDPLEIMKEGPIDYLGLQGITDNLELNEVTKKSLKSINFATTPLILEDQPLLGESSLLQTISPDVIAKSLSIVRSTTGPKRKNPDKSDLDLEAAWATAIDVNLPPGVNRFRYGEIDEQTPGPNFVINPSSPAQDCTTTLKGCDNENVEKDPEVDDPMGIMQEGPINNLGLQGTTDDLELDEATHFATTPLILEDQFFLGESNLPQTISPDPMAKSLSIVKPITGSLAKDENPANSDLDLDAALAAAVDDNMSLGNNGFRYEENDEQTPGSSFVIPPSGPKMFTTNPRVDEPAIFGEYPSEEEGLREITEDLELDEAMKNSAYLVTTPLELGNEGLLGVTNFPKTVVPKTSVKPLTTVKPVPGSLKKIENPNESDGILDLDTAAALGVDLSLGINGFRFDGMKEERLEPNYVINTLEPSQNPISYATTECPELFSNFGFQKKIVDEINPIELQQKPATAIGKAVAVNVILQKPLTNDEELLGGMQDDSLQTVLSTTTVLPYDERPGVTQAESFTENYPKNLESTAVCGETTTELFELEDDSQDSGEYDTVLQRDESIIGEGTQDVVLAYTTDALSIGFESTPSVQETYELLGAFNEKPTTEGKFSTVQGEMTSTAKPKTTVVNDYITELYKYKEDSQKSGEYDTVLQKNGFIINKNIMNNDDGYILEDVNIKNKSTTVNELQGVGKTDPIKDPKGRSKFPNPVSAATAEPILEEVLAQEGTPNVVAAKAGKAPSMVDVKKLKPKLDKNTKEILVYKDDIQKSGEYDTILQKNGFVVDDIMEDDIDYHIKNINVKKPELKSQNPKPAEAVSKINGSSMKILGKSPKAPINLPTNPKTSTTCADIECTEECQEEIPQSTESRLGNVEKIPEDKDIPKSDGVIQEVPLEDNLQIHPEITTLENIPSYSELNLEASTTPVNPSTIREALHAIENYQSITGLHNCQHIDESYVNGHLFFIGDGMKIPLILSQNEYGNIQLTLDMDNVCSDKKVLTIESQNNCDASGYIL